MEVDDDSRPFGNVGGGEPLALSVRQFVAARVSEITSLTAQLSNSGGRTRGFSFQHVSKHMRRRAVSHNPKRLPSRLRQSHLSQLRKSSGGVVKKPKRPRRKYRKRSNQDILEYNRRQLVNPMWLESHIWHAKRFHMKSLWNRKIAISPTAKCFRSLFRAAKQNVTMHDISYMSSLEISGPISLLTGGMAKLIPSGFSTIPQWNKEFLAHVITSSTLNYLGTVKYIWITSSVPSHAKLLIWLHPTMKTHLIDELKLLFQLVEQDFDLNFPEFPTKDEKKHLWKIVNNPRWFNENTHVALNDLEGCFNRIRLTGPKTLSVLKEVLKVGKFILDGQEESGAMEQQEVIWKGTQKLIDLPDSTLIPLNVIDPRRELPDKRRRVTQANKLDASVQEVPLNPKWHELKLDSLLWQDDIRRMVLHTKTSDEKLSKSRSNNLIPGTTVSDEKGPDIIPIVLVTRSHNCTFLGVDLILPCGWLMAFWIALSYRCVRTYALEFNDYLTFEENPHLLDFSTSTLFLPDSVMYKKENEETANELTAKYFRNPPAKRHNLIKLGCAFPFSIDWANFLRLSMQVEESDIKVQVLKNKEDLISMAKCLREFNHNHELFIHQGNKLLPVRVVLLTGAVEKGACICLPTKEDLSLFSSRRHSDVHILQQPFKDVNERKRAELGRQHHKKLSHLRKKRKVARRAVKRGQNKDFDLGARLKELDSKLEVETYNQDMNNLWLNDNIDETLLNQDRVVMGFTEYAHYSFVRGKSAAAGFVAVGLVKPLLQLYSENNIKGKRGLYVLVRNWASSLTYHWAKLDYPNI